jgi:hypothetical protein
VGKKDKIKFGKFKGIVSWIFGIIFSLAGFSSLVSGKILSSIILFIMAAVLLPAVSKILKERMNFELSKWIKIAVVVIGLVVLIVSSGYSNSNNSDGDLNKEGTSIVSSPTTTENRAKPITQNEEPKSLTKYELLAIELTVLYDEKSRIINKYLNKDGLYYYNDLTFSDLNELKIVQQKIKDKLSAYVLTISNKDEEFEYINQTLFNAENSLEQINIGLETVGKVTNIEAYARLSSWDADAAVDGIVVDLRIFSTPYQDIRAKGNLKVTLYKSVGLIDDRKGEFIESFTKELDINDFSVGTCGNEQKKCGFIPEIRFEFTKPNNLGGMNFGYMVVNFETQGKTFEAIDASIQ